MKAQKRLTRIVAALLLVALLVGMLPASVFATEASQASEVLTQTSDGRVTKAADTAQGTPQDRMYYDSWSMTPDYEDCILSQGMAVLGDYIYIAKKNEADTNCAIMRTNRFYNQTHQMTIDGASSVDYLGHANDMCAVKVGTVEYLFVATMKEGVDTLVCYKISGTTLSLVGIIDAVTVNGGPITANSVNVYEVSGSKVTLLITHKSLVFVGTFDVNAPVSELRCELGFELSNESMLAAARAACGMPDLDITYSGTGMFNDTYCGSAFLNDTYYMPVTMHHSQIRVDNHGDSASVIVAFPNIAEAIASTKRDVQASFSETINIPDAGWMFFKIGSVDFADGITYFNTNRVRIDNTLTGVSFLLDPNVDVKTLNERFAYRNDGIYQISDAGERNYLYDPGAADGHIEVGTSTSNRNFGLESNEQGFYYIRSMRSPHPYKYLTVNADSTITLSEKKENDPSQLFCLTQTEWPAEVGRVAIISLLNFQYLQVDSSSPMRLITKSSGKTFRLHEVRDTAGLEEYLFDLNLYKKCYPEVCAGKTDDEIKAYYKSTGIAEGHIGSIFFDPDYYRAHNKDVANHASYNTPAGLYNHFVQHGFWEGRQGSLYFSLKEYMFQPGNANLRQGEWPDKVRYLRHFFEHGANESKDSAHRNGSDEFQVKELVAKYNLSPDDGYPFIVDVISRNVRLKAVETQADLEKLLFDWEYYYGKYSDKLSAAQLDAAHYVGNSHAEKLLDHWTRSGIREGRNASPYFSAIYYRMMYPDCTTIKNPTTDAQKKQANEDAYNHFVTVGFWEGRIGSPYYNGEYYISAMDQTVDNCLHRSTVTMTLKSTCTDTGSERLCCAECRNVLKTRTLPLSEHVDKNADNSCDICGANLSGNAVLKGAIANLVAPVPINEYYDLRGVTFANEMYDGVYYMVQKNSDGKYRVFDTLNQTVRGSFAATQVQEKDGAIIGAHPDMAVEFKFVSAGSSGKEGVYHLKINDSFYLGHGRNTAAGTYGEARRLTSTTNMSLRVLADDAVYGDRFRIYRTIEDPDIKDDPNVPHWLGMHDNDGFKYYRFTTDVYADPENTFYLYKLLLDRVHTEDMYATLKEAAAFIDRNASFNTDKHEDLIYCLKECVSLYNKYNGYVLKDDELENRQTLQETMDTKMQQLINLMGYLKINAENKTIRYFPANMYNYNEDAMNARIDVLPGADTHGFYFEAGTPKNTTAFYSLYDSTTHEQVKGREIRSQMYSITSGIAASHITEEVINPPFANSVVTEDFWSDTPIANAKEVYTNIGVPFVYDDGYYVLNSDANAVFFEGEPASGAKLAILEKPATYYWSGGMTHGVAKPTYVEKDYTTHHYADGYVTAFQPFAKMSNRKAEGYTAEASVFEESDLVEGYLLDGVAYRSATNPVLEVSNSGTAVWGFGMKLSIEFMMTDDGRLVDENKTPITFEFSGDDDVWVYIDDDLVLDIGGSHDAIQGVIDFTDGSVTVRSDKYDRIRDKNTSGYGWSDADKYDPSQLSSVNAITTNAMHQKNIYSEVFGETIEQFANNGEIHTLTVYYMDRGKGRTNSMIKFNLPQTDTLTVEKNVKCADYENGELVMMSAEEAAPLMSELSKREFEFTLTNNNARVGNQTYTLIDNGIDKGEKATDQYGRFKLKHGQSAVFYGLNFTAANKYKLTETAPIDTWYDVSWTHTTTGNATVTATAPTNSQTTYNANVSSTVAISGDLYANETLTFNCTNTFVRTPLEKDQVVLDYGKSVNVDVFENDPQMFFAKDYLRTLQGFVPYSENLDMIASRKVAGSKTLVTENGNYSIIDNKVHFEPKRMLEEIEKVYCVVKYTKGTDFFYMYEELQIIPSNIMYYETDFADEARDLPGVNDYLLLDFGADDTTVWNTLNGITIPDGPRNGVLHGDIDSSSTPWMGMLANSNQLDYMIKPGDVINIRLKVTLQSYKSRTGIQFFFATPQHTNYKEGTSVKDSAQKTHYSGEYVTLQYPINSLLFDQKLTALRVDPFDNASNIKGTVDIDYIYVGPAPQDDFLYFGFDNTDIDRVRYSQSQYGGNNYDEADWSSRFYTMNPVTIDNTNGEIRATTLTNPDTTVEAGYYFQSSAILSEGLDLRYDPSEAEVVSVRMKLENFVADGTPNLSVLYYLDDSADHNPNDGRTDELHILSQSVDIAPSDVTSGEYFTVCVPATDLQQHDRISAVRINVTGVKDVQAGQGVFSMDYVYVGPEETAPVEDYLFFDFGNTAADQIRYRLPIYGGENHDTRAWSRRSFTCDPVTIDNSKGELILNAKANPDTTKGDLYYCQSSAAVDSGFTLQYDPSEAEVIYVRAKAENFTPQGTPKLSINYYVGDVANYDPTTQKDSEVYSLSQKATINPNYITKGEYFTVCVPATQMQAHDRISTVRVNFESIADDRAGSGVITIDYIFVGSEEDYQKLDLANRGVVYTDAQSDWKTVTDTTAPDAEQDNGLLKNDGYILLNFDGNVDFSWQSSSANTTVSFDPIKGLMKGEISGGDPYVGMDRNGNQVNYKFKKGDVVQVRMKAVVHDTDNMADATSGFQFFFVNRGDNTYYAVEDRNYVRTFDQWEIITLPVPDQYIGMETGSIRIDPIDTLNTRQLNASYEVDFIYVGPEDRAPGNASIYFSFDNDDLSHARYGTEFYGGFNGDIDPWSTNLVRNTELFEGEDEGTRAFSEHKDNDQRYHYIRSSADGVRGYSLNHIPSADDVLQVRVKFKNFKQGNSKPYLTLTYYSRGTIHGDATSGDAGVEVSRRLYFDPAYLNSNEYVTLTLPMDEKYAARDKITTFCVFLNEMISISKTELGVATIDYIYLGPPRMTPKADDMTLGYDSHYADDCMLSDSSSLQVEGLGVPKLNPDYTPKPGVFTETSFTFTGTGFDIISRTGAQQGAIRVMIFKQNGEYKKTVSVANMSEKKLELYQVPVISVQDLEHGTYNVRIFVNAPYTNADIPELNRGGEFHFDAIRIYNPIDTTTQASEDSKTAHDAYLGISESDQEYTEVRKMMIDAQSFSAEGSMNGVIYLDNTDKLPTIGNYESVGPNNEAYLAKGTAIAFKLLADGVIPTSIDIGVRAADGKSANLTARVASDMPTVLPTKQERTISSSTVQYYSIDIPATAWNMNQDSHHVYVTIGNADGEGILSLTDVKYAYDCAAIPEKQGRKLRFVVDSDTLEKVNLEVPKEEPTVTEALSFSTSITAGAEMNVAYSFMASTVAAYDDFYLEVTKAVAGGEPITVTYDKASMIAVPNPITGEPLMYRATYRGINAKEMGDSFTATLYAIAKDGSVHCSRAESNSIKGHLLEKFAAENASAEFKTMAVDMLKYGEAAQKLFGYNTDNLVTADLTEEQLSYATTELPEASDISAISGTGAKISANVTVGAKVQLHLSVMKSGLVNPDAVRCEIRDTDGNLIAEPEVGNVMDMMYSATYGNVGAKEMRKPICVRFCMGDEVISQTITWSIESYVAQICNNENSTQADIAMVNAMLTYGDSVAAYMAAQKAK